jgi:hypothetical protein
LCCGRKFEFLLIVSILQSVNSYFPLLDSQPKKN